MHIGIERHADIGVTQDHAERLGVKAQLDAVGSKGMPQAVKVHIPDTRLEQDRLETALQGPRFQELFRAGEHKAVRFPPLPLQIGKEKRGQRDGPEGALAFRRIKNHGGFVPICPPAGISNPLHRPPDREELVVR